MRVFWAAGTLIPAGAAAMPTRWPGGLKPRSPLLACTCVGLKPPSPLRAGEVGRLKPPSPLRAGEVGQLKPASPLRARNGCFSCVVCMQRCCGFQWLLFVGELWRWRFHGGLHQWSQWCLRFHYRHVDVSRARNRSPGERKMADNRCFMARWASFIAPTDAAPSLPPRRRPPARRPGRRSHHAHGPTPQCGPLK